MDPVSAMATASAAFSALKKGFAIGRDIESMASDLSRWMGALSDLDQAEKEAKNLLSSRNCLLAKRRARSRRGVCSKTESTATTLRATTMDQPDLGQVQVGTSLSVWKVKSVNADRKLCTHKESGVVSL